MLYSCSLVVRLSLISRKYFTSTKAELTWPFCQSVPVCRHSTCSRSLRRKRKYRVWYPVYEMTAENCLQPVSKEQHANEQATATNDSTTRNKFSITADHSHEEHSAAILISNVWQKHLYAVEDKMIQLTLQCTASVSSTSFFNSEDTTRGPTLHPFLWPAQW